MTNVFLSYDRDDTAKARLIAASLKKGGHSVWWDQHIKSGSQYSKDIEAALKAAEAVIVLWSSRSVESPWVRDEAAAGRDAGRLVPISLDGTQPPLGFRQYQTIDLSRWNGRGTPPQMRTLITDVEQLAASKAPLTSSSSDTKPRTLAATLLRERSLLLPTGVLVLLLSGTGSYFWLRSNDASQPRVAIIASDQSELSQRLAKNVLVTLGGLQNAESTNVRLVDAQSGERSNLQIKLNSSLDGRQVISNVSLVSNADQSVLWSRQFKQTGSTDLNGPIAVVVARVLGCVAEGLSARLSAQTQQVYLRACTTSDEVGWDIRTLIPMLRKVTDENAGFGPAWARLLSAEALGVRRLSISEQAGPLRSDLQRDAVTVRKALPGLPEIALAGALALPNTSLEQSIATLDKAIADHPDNANLLTTRSRLLLAVGRVREAVRDADQAANLDKLSPVLRSAYIMSLLADGKIDEARSDLARAKQLWPAAAPIQDAETEIELRYGDFVKALPLSGARMDGGIRAYITARQEPSKFNKDAFIHLAQTHQLTIEQKLFLLESLPGLDRVDDLYSLANTWPADVGLFESTDILFSPWTSKFRRDPRFMRYAQRVKLIDYWKKTGAWPDFCSEPDMLYDCKSEAMKLEVPDRARSPKSA